MMVLGTADGDEVLPPAVNADAAAAAAACANAGDICEQLGDAACLATLQKLAAAAPHSEWRNFAERACIEGGAADPAFAAEVQLLPPPPLEDQLAISAAANVAADAECAVCSTATDKICLATLDAAYDALSDKARLKFERAAMDADGANCEGLKDIACLEVLDALAAGLSDKDRLQQWRDACATGLLDTESSFETHRSKTGMTAAEALEALSAATEAFAQTPVASANAVSSAATCGACSAASDDECLATLDGALAALSDKDRLLLERATFLSGPDERALEQASAGVRIPVLHEGATALVADTASAAASAARADAAGGAARLCDGLDDRDCLATLDLKLELLNRKQRLGVLAAACNRGILATTNDRVAIAALNLDAVAGMPEGEQTASPDSASAPDTTPTAGGLPSTPSSPSTSEGEGAEDENGENENNFAPIA